MPVTPHLIVSRVAIVRFEVDETKNSNRRIIQSNSSPKETLPKRNSALKARAFPNPILYIIFYYSFKTFKFQYYKERID